MTWSNAMTSTSLTRAAGAAAVLSGLIFVGVQINHPHLDTTSITTAEVAVRNSLKVLMGAAGLVGVTGMYLSQIRRNGLVGLLGYAVISTCYLLVMGTSFLAAAVLPSIAATDPSYVQDVLVVFTGGAATGDIGPLSAVFRVQSIAFLAGGVLFGVALFRARVLSRWATALLAVGGGVSAVLAVLPDPFYRLLAIPNGIAMIGLGYSLWRTARADVTAQPVPARTVTTAGAE
jgi:hypothetical protein